MTDSVHGGVSRIMGTRKKGNTRADEDTFDAEEAEIGCQGRMETLILYQRYYPKK